MMVRISFARWHSLLAALTLSLSFAACGGSDGDDDGDNGGDEGEGIQLPENCTQADQFCASNANYGFRCKNGEWATWNCNEGTTCHRADDGYLSCVPTDGHEESDAGSSASDGGSTSSSSTSGGSSAGITYVSIPAGSYTIPLDHANAHSYYVPGTPIPISAFKIGKTPVTVAQFEKCVKAGRCQGVYGIYRANNDDYDECNYGRGSGWSNHPMNCVTWYGAMEFCEWAGGRLPTEVEWIFAASHNGTKFLNTKYPWGNKEPTHCVEASYFDDSLPTNRRYCNGTKEVSYENRSGTSAVDAHPKGNSPLGIQDMVGNVWEWTNKDFMGMDNVVFYMKGGGFYNELYDIDNGYMFSAGRWGSGIGFRCVKD